MATQKTTAELLQESIDKLGSGTPLLAKTEHKPLLDNLINSLLNKDTDKGLLSLFQHDPARAYVQGEGVLNNQQLWQAINNISASTPFDPNLWTQITGQTSLSDYNFNEWDPDFLGGAGYPQDAKVTRDDRLWNSDSDSNTQDPLSGGWTEISANDGDFGNIWEVGVYNLNQVVTNPSDNKLYVLDPGVSEPFSSVDIDAEITGDDWILFHDLTSGVGNRVAIFNSLGRLASSAMSFIGNNLTLPGHIEVQELIDLESLSQSSNFQIRYEGETLVMDGGSDILEARNTTWEFFKRVVTREFFDIKVGSFLASIKATGTTADRTHLLQNKDGTLAHLADFSLRNNFVLVKSKSDFPSPAGGIILLDNNTTYEINGLINLGTDHIVTGLSNIIYGIDKSNDILVYTGTGGAIRVENQDFSLWRVTIVAGVTGAQCWDLAGDDTNIVEISSCIFGDSTMVGSVSGGMNVFIFSDNLITNCKEGIELTGLNTGISIGGNYFDTSFSGTSPTWINVPSGTYTHLDITHNLFTVDSGETAINIVEASVTRTAIVVQQNIIAGVGDGLTGINANDQGMIIPANSNKGIAGLFRDGKTIVLGSWVSTITSFVQIPETLIIGNPTNFENNATTFKAFLAFSATHDDNGGTMETEIYNLTDGVAVAGSQKTTTITTGGVFQKDVTPEVVLLANKTYRVRFRKISGAGGASVFINAGSMEIKVF